MYRSKKLSASAISAGKEPESLRQRFMPIRLWRKQARRHKAKLTTGSLQEPLQVPRRLR